MAQDPLDRPLPSNVHAERIILGSCLDSTNTAGVAEALMKLERDDFSLHKHQLILECLKTLVLKGVPLDYVVVSEWFRARGRLDEVNGISGLVELSEGLPEILNLNSYVDIVKKLASLRRIIFLSREVYERAFLEEEQPEVLAVHFAKSLGQLASENEENGPQSMAEFVDSYKGGVDALMTPHLTQPGIPVGFPRFDALTDGLHEDEIYTIGATSAAGKTSLGLQWCRYIAQDGGLPVMIFSMEMSKRSLFYRMICDEAQVAFQRFRRGEYSPAEGDKLREAARLIYGLPLYVDERSSASPADYRMRLKALRDKHGVRVAMIDYAQLMSPDNKRMSGTEKMSSICTGIQSAVKDTHVPLILLSQLNREAVKGKRKPEMYDLRETGVLENISDIVAMIWRENAVSQEKGLLKDRATLLIRKARNAETKEIAMRFMGWRMHFEELTQEEQDALG